MIAPIAPSLCLPRLVTLGAILISPPLTSGERTLARLDTARRLLQADRVAVANLLDVPTTDIRQVSILGRDRESWLASRNAVEKCVIACDTVLLGFGVSKPAGDAGVHFQRQVDWLHALLLEHGGPVYTVGGKPRHPSRWQRWTTRAQPGVPFDEALKRELSVTATAGAAVSTGLPTHRP